jgi:CheY-like chemotaxis protein
LNTGRDLRVELSSRETPVSRKASTIAKRVSSKHDSLFDGRATYGVRVFPDNRAMTTIRAGGEPPRAASVKRLRIIVADDDRDTLETLALLLLDEGHEVRTVSRGSQVLRAVLDYDPDAVLLDIGLPEVSGHDLARKIRECCGTKRPLLIGISGRYKQHADKTLARLNGMNHYLVKPYNPGLLFALLAALPMAGA